MTSRRSTPVIWPGGSPRRRAELDKSVDEVAAQAGGSRHTLVRVHPDVVTGRVIVQQTEPRP
jgi:hypothetical protein